MCICHVRINLPLGTYCNRYAQFLTLGLCSFSIVKPHISIFDLEPTYDRGRQSSLLQPPLLSLTQPNDLPTPNPYNITSSTNHSRTANMPPLRGRAEKEQTEFDFDPEGDVTLVFTLTEKEPEAAENGTARAASVPNPIGTLSSARFSP